MKFKSVSNICFRKAFYAHYFVRGDRQNFYWNCTSLSRALYRSRSSFESQLLISYAFAIWSLFTINGYEWNSAISSKIQIRVTNYPSRDSPFSPSPAVTCCRCIRLDRKSNRTAFLRATDRATTPITADGSTRSPDITPLALGVRRGMEKFDLDENFRMVGIANGRRSFFRNFHEQFHSRAFSYSRVFALIQPHYLYFPPSLFFLLRASAIRTERQPLFFFFYNM